MFYILHKGSYLNTRVLFNLLNELGKEMKYCLNFGLNLKILKCICLFVCYTARVADLNDHFANAFVRENVAYCYDV